MMGGCFEGLTWFCIRLEFFMRMGEAVVFVAVILGIINFLIFRVWVKKDDTD